MYAHTGERSENVNDHSSNNSARRSGRRTWASRFLFIVGVAGAAFLGASTHEAAAQNNVSQIDTAHYSVAVTAIPLTRSRLYQATQTGSATFTVLSKLPYTVDRNHPWTLTLHNPPDLKVAYAKTVYNRADALLTDNSVTFSVPFLTVAAGRGTIEGVVDVRVCGTDGRCETKSEQVALAIDIGAAPAP
jgi:hypothetical protein